MSLYCEENFKTLKSFTVSKILRPKIGLIDPGPLIFFSAKLVGGAKSPWSLWSFSDNYFPCFPLMIAVCIIEMTASKSRFQQMISVGTVIKVIAPYCWHFSLMIAVGFLDIKKYWLQLAL